MTSTFAPRRSRTTTALRAVTLAIALSSIAGCSSLPDRQPPGSASLPIGTLAPRAAAATFTATGRVAARDTGDARRGFSGGFAWTHSPAEDIVELLTPLGQIAARMSLTSAGATIELADGRRTFAADPERFLSDELGITLPLGALPYWLQAVPLSKAKFQAEADALGRPTMLWQNGWEIQYTAYAGENVGAYPTRMQLTQGTVEARMIISEWSAK